MNHVSNAGLVIGLVFIVIGAAVVYLDRHGKKH
jgi:hypothetical protein